MDRLALRTPSAIVLLMSALAGCGGVGTRGDGVGSVPARPPVSTSSPVTAPATSMWSGGEPRNVPPIDTEDVPDASVPIVLSEHLHEVQLAVRADVGDAVFAGSRVAESDSVDITMTIYGTDGPAITSSLDGIDSELRDRIDVVETDHSLEALETFAAQAAGLLGAAGIDATVAVGFGTDVVTVLLETQAGQPIDRQRAHARAVLADVPVVIEFRGTMRPLAGAVADQP